MSPKDVRCPWKQRHVSCCYIYDFFIIKGPRIFFCPDDSIVFPNRTPISKDKIECIVKKWMKSLTYQTNTSVRKHSFRRWLTTMFLIILTYFLNMFNFKNYHPHPYFWCGLSIRHRLRFEWSNTMDFCDLFTMCYAAIKWFKRNRTLTQLNWYLDSNLVLFYFRQRVPSGRHSLTQMCTLLKYNKTDFSPLFEITSLDFKMILHPVLPSSTLPSPVPYIRHVCCFL